MAVGIVVNDRNLGGENGKENRFYRARAMKGICMV